MKGSSISATRRPVSLPEVCRPVSIVTLETSIWLVPTVKSLRPAIEQLAVPLAVTTIQKVSFPFTVTITVAFSLPLFSISFPVPVPLSLLSIAFPLSFPVTNVHYPFSITISIPLALSFTVAIPPAITGTTSPAKRVTIIQIRHTATAAAPTIPITSTPTTHGSAARMVTYYRRTIVAGRRGGHQTVS